MQLLFLPISLFDEKLSILLVTCILIYLNIKHPSFLIIYQKFIQLNFSSSTFYQQYLFCGIIID